MLRCVTRGIGQGSRCEVVRLVNDLSGAPEHASVSSMPPMVAYQSAPLTRTFPADSSAFGAGDVVGCGLLWALGHVFFTVNGEWKGFLLDAEVAPGCSLVPCAGLRSPTVLVFNTGAKPFCCSAATLSSVAQASTKLDEMQGGRVDGQAEPMNGQTHGHGVGRGGQVASRTAGLGEGGRPEKGGPNLGKSNQMDTGQSQTAVTPR